MFYKISDVYAVVLNNFKIISKFEHYNQINFYKAPELIIKVLKGFLQLGGYSKINIGFDSLSTEEIAPELKEEVLRLTKLANEFGESQKAEGSWYNLYYFICSFKDYNDIAFDLFNSNSPLNKTIGNIGYDSYNLFEYAIDKNNIEFAMKMIELFDISEVISFFPLKVKTLKNLLNSDYIVQFLHYIADNKDKITELVNNNIDTAPILNYRSRFSEINEMASNNYADSSQHYILEEIRNIVYICYEKQQMLEKLGSDIELFNLLFFVTGRYTLDELTKTLTLEQIKALNAKGYIIGKWICYTDYYQAKLHESIDMINNINDQVYEDAKDYYAKSNKLGNELTDILELEISIPGVRYFRGQT